MNEWTWTFNGLTFGGATPYGVSRVEGIGVPDSRVDEVVKVGTHGSFVLADTLDARRVVFEGDIYAEDADTFAALVNAWRAAFVPSVNDQPLGLLIPGEDQRRINCVPTRRFLPIENDEYELFYAEWAVEFVAGDPRIYSDVEHAEFTGPVVTSGMIFPEVFDMTFGGGTGGASEITNAGVFDTLPVVIIQGPVTNPTIRSLTQDKALDFTIVLGENDVLTIDFNDRTVLFNGANRYSALDESSSWWTLQPGDNVIQYQGSVAEGSQATIRWRDAWV